MTTIRLIMLKLRLASKNLPRVAEIVSTIYASLAAAMALAGGVIWLTSYPPINRATSEGLAYIRESLGDLVFGIVTLPLTVVAGVAFYVIRCRRRHFYGWVEVFVGSLSALIVARQLYSGRVMPVSVQVFFSELAALYILVRGFDNIHQGLSSNAKQAWEKKFYGRPLANKD